MEMRFHVLYMSDRSRLCTLSNKWEYKVSYVPQRYVAPAE